MAHMGGQYGRQTDEYGNPIHQTDAYGNPIRQTDEYGNPIHQTGAGAGATTGGTTLGMGGHHGATQLHRSGSGSSSSSEDDGQGGRRKKGIKDKIKEKLPGHKDPHATATTTPGGYHSAEEPYEKKGIMDKIKEKLPGGQH